MEIDKGLVRSGLVVVALLVVAATGAIVAPAGLAGPETDPSVALGKWTTYNSATSGFPSDLITALAVDSQERIWVGTDGGGVGMFDGATWTTYDNANTAGGLVSDDVLSLATAGDRILVGTNGTGLGVLDTTTGIWTTYDTGNTTGLASDTINAVATAGDIWWVATPAGLSRRGPLGGAAWDSFTTANSGLSHDNVLSLSLDELGWLWIGTCGAGGGVDRFDGSSWVNWNAGNSDLPGNCVRASVVAGDGAKWFATSSGDIHLGVVRFDDVTWEQFTTTTPGSGLTHDFVADLVADRADRVWMATADGLAVRDPGGWDSFSTAAGLASNNLAAVAVNGERLWVGTADAGTTVFDRNWRSLRAPKDGLAQNDVNALLLEAGLAWFGTDAGLSRFDGTSWTTFAGKSAGGPLPDDQVQALAKDDAGHYWIGTPAGIAVFDGGSVWSYHDAQTGLPDDDVRVLARDTQDRMWAGTAAGASLYDGGWVGFDSGNSPLPGDDVRALAPDNQDGIWIGVYGGGVGVYDGLGWTVYDATDGLPSNDVTALVNDGLGNMWVGTRAGIGVFDGAAWMTHTVATGLPDDEVLGLHADPQGRVWAATNGGGVSRWSGTHWLVLNSRNSGLAGDVVSTVGADSAGGVWFGGEGTGVSVRGSFAAPFGRPAPEITGFDPTSGGSGTLVTISGVNFDDRDPAWNDVRLCPTVSLCAPLPLTVLTVTSTTLQVAIPPSAEHGYFRVETDGGFDISATRFTILPSVGSFEPTGGSAGQRVTIYGNNLDVIDRVTLGGAVTVIEEQGPYEIVVRLWQMYAPVVAPFQLHDDDTGTVVTTDDEFTVVTLEYDGFELNQGVAGYPLIIEKDTILRVFFSSSSEEYPAHFNELVLTMIDETGDVCFEEAHTGLEALVDASGQIVSGGNDATIFRLPGAEITRDCATETADHHYEIQGRLEVRLMPTLPELWAVLDVPAEFERAGAFQWGFPTFTTFPADPSLHLLVMEIERSYELPAATLYRAQALNTISRLFPIAHGVGPEGGLDVTYLGDRLRLPGFKCEPGNTGSWNIGGDAVRTTLALGLLEARREWYNLLHPFNKAQAIAGFVHDDCAAGALGIASAWPIASSITVLRPGNTGATAVQELGHTFWRVPPWSPNRCRPDSNCPGGGGIADAHSIFQTASPADASAFNIFTAQDLTANNRSVMSYAGGQTNSNVLFEIGDYSCLRQWPSFCTGPEGGADPFVAAAERVLSALGARAPGAGQTLNMVGLLHPDDRLEVLDSFLTADDTDYTAVSGETYRLVFLSGSAELASEPFDPELPDIHDQNHATGSPALLNLRRPLPAGTDRVEIRHDNSVLAAIAPGPAPPTVTLVSPNGGESFGSDEDVLIEWDGSDPDGDAVSYAIAYSADDGDSYTVVSSGVTETQYLWNTASVAGSSQALIRVIASDGLYTGDDLSDAPFSVAGHAPNVAIVNPPDGQVFSQHERIALQGFARDAEDGTLGGEGLAWESNRDGELGTGARIELTDLTLGSHTITLEAVDGEAVTATHQITIEIARDFDRDGLLDSYENGYVSLNFWDPSDATADGDLDNLTNLQEAFYGCHPEQADSDGDTINDGLEVAAGTDCADPASQPQPPELALGPSELSFTAQAGEVAPTIQGVEIANTGSGVLTWTVTVGPAWLSADPLNGTGTGVLEVAADATGLTEGAYNGYLTIAGVNTAAEPQTVTVKLAVVPAGQQPGERLFLPILLR